jgi:hypothetical protein
VKPPRVSESIKTYLLTISNLTTQTLMKDNLDDSIINMIKTPTERTAVLRIARVASLLEEEILRGFWDRGEAYLNKRLAEKKLTYWSLDRSEGSPLLQSRYDIAIVGKGVDRERPACAIWTSSLVEGFQLCRIADSSSTKAASFSSARTMKR